MIEQWQLGLVVTAVLLNVLVSYRMYLIYSGDAGTGSGVVSGGESLVDLEEGVVECPECGTENEYGYRFCRSCVGELPGAMDFGGTADIPLGRLSR